VCGVVVILGTVKEGEWGAGTIHISWAEKVREVFHSSKVDPIPAPGFTSLYPSKTCQLSPQQDLLVCLLLARA